MLMLDGLIYPSTGLDRNPKSKYILSYNSSWLPHMNRIFFYSMPISYFVRPESVHLSMRFTKLKMAHDCHRAFPFQCCRTQGFTVSDQRKLNEIYVMIMNYSILQMNRNEYCVCQTVSNCNSDLLKTLYYILSFWIWFNSIFSTLREHLLLDKNTKLPHFATSESELDVAMSVLHRMCYYNTKWIEL